MKDLDFVNNREIEEPEDIEPDIKDPTENPEIEDPSDKPVIQDPETEKPEIEDPKDHGKIRLT